MGQNFQDARNLREHPILPLNFTHKETKAQERQTDLLQVMTPN
jgi:hypothetical protein